MHTSKWIFPLLVAVWQLAGMVFAQGTITTVAGGPAFVFTGDGKAAVDTPLGSIAAVAVDAAGNVYAADNDNRFLVRISQDGVLHVVPGTEGRQGSALAVDQQSNVYVLFMGISSARPPFFV